MVMFILIRNKIVAVLKPMPIDAPLHCYVDDT